MFSSATARSATHHYAFWFPPLTAAYTIQYRPSHEQAGYGAQAIFLTPPDRAYSARLDYCVTFEWGLYFRPGRQFHKGVSCLSHHFQKSVLTILFYCPPDLLRHALRMIFCRGVFFVFVFLACLNRGPGVVYLQTGAHRQVFTRACQLLCFMSFLSVTVTER